MDFLAHVTLKSDGWHRKNWAPLLHYIKLCASLQSHRVIQNGVAVNSGQNRWFMSRVTLKFDGWPWKIIGHLFYTTLSFLHNSKAIGELKLEWQSGNAQFGSKSAIFLFIPCDLEIWWSILKHNRAPLIRYIKLCTSFHRCIQTWVTDRKRSLRVKIGNFLSPVTLKFDRWPWKTKGHLFYADSTFLYHFIAIGEFKLELQSGNAQFGSNSTIF